MLNFRTPKYTLATNTEAIVDKCEADLSQICYVTGKPLSDRQNATERPVQSNHAQDRHRPDTQLPRNADLFTQHWSK